MAERQLPKRGKPARKLTASRPATVEEVREQFGTLRYMTYRQARRLQEFLTLHALKDCLELGFYHGLSSAYIAAILHANGGGHLTTLDLLSARDRSPNIDAILGELGLTNLSPSSTSPAPTRGE